VSFAIGFLPSLRRLYRGQRSFVLTIDGAIIVLQSQYCLALRGVWFQRREYGGAARVRVSAVGADNAIGRT
jgi:hypothetical protein